MDLGLPHIRHSCAFICRASRSVSLLKNRFCVCVLLVTWVYVILGVMRADFHAHPWSNEGCCADKCIPLCAWGRSNKDAPAAPGARWQMWICSLCVQIKTFTLWALKLLHSWMYHGALFEVWSPNLWSFPSTQSHDFHHCVATSFSYRTLWHRCLNLLRALGWDVRGCEMQQDHSTKYSWCPF